MLKAGFLGLMLAMQDPHEHTLGRPAPLGPPGISNTYVITQHICLPPQISSIGQCLPQTVAVGADVEIQLPGTPSGWKLVSALPNLRIVSGKRVRSPDRIEGTSEVYIFVFRVTGPGMATIRMRESPPLISAPVGTFTYTIHAR